ncbi:hypothetical protein Mpsy_0527 [Methanolobus psychrophilus R15]|nr:hypothetical protein Mpsy_0527 [Methanolobus psychrophilus R15]
MKNGMIPEQVAPHSRSVSLTPYAKELSEYFSESVNKYSYNKL